MANFFKKTINILDFRAVIQAQLVERLLLTSVIRGSNLVISKFNLLLIYSKQLCWKDENKEKRPGKAKKKKIIICQILIPLQNILVKLKLRYFFPVISLRWELLLLLKIDK